MVFKFCPQCRAAKIRNDGLRRYWCTKCGWVFFRNVACAVGVIIEYRGRLLFAIRNKQPAKGKFGLPGGFVDPGESAEEAARRETRDEIRIELGGIRYFGSYPNRYRYEGVKYNTCDLIYVARIRRLQAKLGDEVRAIELLRPEEVQLNRIAFKSLRAAVADYIKVRCRD